jgi:hypothetical protein
LAALNPPCTWSDGNSFTRPQEVHNQVAAIIQQLLPTSTTTPDTVFCKVELGLPNYKHATSLQLQLGATLGTRPQISGVTVGDTCWGTAVVASGHHLSRAPPIPLLLDDALRPTARRRLPSSACHVPTSATSMLLACQWCLAVCCVINPEFVTHSPTPSSQNTPSDR